MRLVRGGVEHETLDCLGFRLMVNQIPFVLAQSIALATLPERRERSAVRLDFPVADIVKSRQNAERLGGQIDGSFFLGYDPEGNVVGVVLDDNAVEPRRER
jgi:hypothetical protein